MCRKCGREETLDELLLPLVAIAVEGPDAVEIVSLTPAFIERWRAILRAPGESFAPRGKGTRDDANASDSPFACEPRLSKDSREGLSSDGPA